MGFYRDQAQTSIDTPDKYGRLEGFTYFELAATSVDTTLFEQIGRKYEKFKPLLVGYDKMMAGETKNVAPTFGWMKSPLSRTSKELSRRFLRSTMGPMRLVEFLYETMGMEATAF